MALLESEASVSQVLLLCKHVYIHMCYPIGSAADLFFFCAMPSSRVASE